MRKTARNFKNCRAASGNRASSKTGWQRVPDYPAGRRALRVGLRASRISAVARAVELRSHPVSLPKSWQRVRDSNGDLASSILRKSACSLRLPRYPESGSRQGFARITVEIYEICMQSCIAMIRDRGLQKIIGELQAPFARHNAGAAPSAKAVFNPNTMKSLYAHCY